MSSIQDLVLKDKNVPVMVSAKYLDHIDVSSPNSTTELPKCIDINNRPISLVDDLPSHPLALQT